MSKLQEKIDGELWERGKLFIHGDCEPEMVIGSGKTTVDIEALKKALADMMRKVEN